MLIDIFQGHNNSLRILELIGTAFLSPLILDGCIFMLNTRGDRALGITFYI